MSYLAVIWKRKSKAGGKILWMKQGFFGYREKLIHNISGFGRFGEKIPKKPSLGRNRMDAMVDALAYSACCTENEEERKILPQVIYRSELLRTLGENSAAIIHELKSPLAGIRAQLQLLERQLVLGRSEDTLVQDRFGLIFGEIGRMSQLINEFLTLSSQREPHLQKLEPVLLIEQTVLLLKSLCLNAGVILESDLPASSRQLWGDEQQLKQVLVNLIVNAQQACSCGCHILVRLSYLPNDICIIVEDDGAGMETEVLNRIFDVFYTTKEKGNGLGLAIVRQIVESHQGRIEVFSKPGEGSRFQITLPCLFELIR